jgi:hypothetical protein
MRWSAVGHEQTKSHRRIESLHLDKQTSVAADGKSAKCSDIRTPILFCDFQTTAHNLAQLGTED